VSHTQSVSQSVSQSVYILGSRLSCIFTECGSHARPLTNKVDVFWVQVAFLDQIFYRFEEQTTSRSPNATNDTRSDFRNLQTMGSFRSKNCLTHPRSVVCLLKVTCKVKWVRKGKETHLGAHHVNVRVPELVPELIVIAKGVLARASLPRSVRVPR
jgi:hypothetical protein